MRHELIAGASLILSACGRLDFDSGCPDLIAYWPLDEASGLVAHDLSPWAQDGDLGGTTTWTAGKVGGALQFDGVDGTITLRRSTGFGFDGGFGSFTVSYWVAPTSLTNTTDIRTFELAFCTNHAYILTGIDANGAAALSGYDGAGNFTRTASANGVLTLGEWTHVAHVVDRATQIGQTYINGVASGGPNDISPWTEAIDCSEATNYTSIGGWGTFYYAGALDEVRFYSRALASSKIQMLFETNATCP